LRLAEELISNKQTHWVEPVPEWAAFLRE